MQRASFHFLGQHCLGAFSQFAKASLAAFYRIDENLQACEFQLLGMQAPMHDTYLSQFKHLDPLNPSACASAGLPVMSLQQGLRRQPSTNNHPYQRFLKLYSIIDVVEVVAHVGTRPVAGISLLRHADLGCFKPEELAGLHPLHGLMQMAAQTLAVGPCRFAGLTPREREIAELLRDGNSNKELARQLGLGLPTVKTHMLNLFRKVGVTSRTELVSTLFL